MTPEKIILDELRDGGERSGAQIAASTNLGSGTLYPALASLERDGKLTSRWADESYPRRRLYKSNNDVL